MSVSADLIPAEIDVLFALYTSTVRYLTEAQLAEDLDLPLGMVRSAINTLRLRSLATPDRRGLSNAEAGWSITTLGDAVADEMRTRDRFS